MRQIITQAVPTMATPSADQRAEATKHGGSQAHNDQYQTDWPCLNTVEVCAPLQSLDVPKILTVAAWNLERCKRVEDSADLLRRAGADVVLATEMDWGMARSGQRHTTRDLAALLGMGYVWGVEFVELGTGDPFETSLFDGVPNDHGLHGNAILSRYPIEKPSVIPLDGGGLWYVGAPKNDGQFRVGGRMAVAARIGGVSFASVHYESQSTAESRAEQTAQMLTVLDQHYGRGPAVIGGDLNTAALADGTRTGTQILAHPQAAEPSFATLAAAGFGWAGANTGDFTTRAAPGRQVSYPLKVLDWLFTRDVPASDPQVWPAVSDAGHYLSDHELITARIARP